MHVSDLSQYDYELPPELVRTRPIAPRDSARLFIYDTATDTVTFDTFRNLARHLPPESVLVLNDTRVRPARLWLRKPTGGKIEVLVLVNEWDGEGLIPGIVDRRAGLGERLRFPNGDALVAEKQVEQKFFFRLESEQGLLALLEAYGVTPIPHYLESEELTDESMLRTRYQTIFADSGASVAAPTASLHFTKEVFASLDTRGIDRALITLNVGLGTFAPLSEENFEQRALHREFVSVSEVAAKKMATAKQAGKPLTAAGTTVIRTLETIARGDTFASFQGPIETFIFPPYHFRAVDQLLTNFHLPRTSLMLLVDAFLQDRRSKRGVVDLYRLAIEERFAFYSFGDSMLIV